MVTVSQPNKNVDEQKVTGPRSKFGGGPHIMLRTEEGSYGEREWSRKVVYMCNESPEKKHHTIKGATRHPNHADALMLMPNNIVRSESPAWHAAPGLTASGSVRQDNRNVMILARRISAGPEEPAARLGPAQVITVL
jgi:hypothetical protein